MLNDEIKVGSVVAVVMRSPHRGLWAVRLVTIERATPHGFITDHGTQYWDKRGYARRSPTSKANADLYLSAELADVAAAHTETERRIVARREEAQRLEEKKEFLARKDVQLAQRLLTGHLSDEEATRFWLRLGEARLQEIVNELEAKGAYAQLHRVDFEAGG